MDLWSNSTLARHSVALPLFSWIDHYCGYVGENLASYVESDMFLTRDAVFTWEEAHKDAHLWEFGTCDSSVPVQLVAVPAAIIPVNMQWLRPMYIARKVDGELDHEHFLRLQFGRTTLS